MVSAVSKLSRIYFYIKTQIEDNLLLVSSVIHLLHCAYIICSHNYMCRGGGLSERTIGHFGTMKSCYLFDYVFLPTLRCFGFLFCYFLLSKCHWITEPVFVRLFKYFSSLSSTSCFSAFNSTSVILTSSAYWPCHLSATILELYALL